MAQKISVIHLSSLFFSLLTTRISLKPLILAMGRFVLLFRLGEPFSGVHLPFVFRGPICSHLISHPFYQYNWVICIIPYSIISIISLLIVTFYALFWNPICSQLPKKRKIHDVKKLTRTLEFSEGRGTTPSRASGSWYWWPLQPTHRECRKPWRQG